MTDPFDEVGAGAVVILPTYNETENLELIILGSQAAVGRVHRRG